MTSDYPRRRDPKSALRQLVAEKAKEKIAQEMAKQADKVAGKVAGKVARTADNTAAKVTTKTAKHLESLDKVAERIEGIGRVVDHLNALDVWTRGTSETRRPRLSRDDIAMAAVRIADAHGIAAVSMRRIAAELEVGTMTLYHYVWTKDELLSLVFDAVAAELIVPDDEPLPTDWKAAMTVLARRSRAALQRHMWILDITDDPPIGPNTTRHFDQSIAAVASMPGTLEDKLDVITSVDEYVFGHCLFERNNIKHESGQVDRMLDYITTLVETGNYPRIEALIAEHGLSPLWNRIEAHARDDKRFERNLARLLSGVERDIASRR